MKTLKGLNLINYCCKNLFTFYILILISVLCQKTLYGQNIFPSNSKKNLNLKINRKPIDDFLNSPPKSSNSLLVLKENKSGQAKILYEWHKPPFFKEKKHISWSVSKTIVQILIGIAIKEKKLTIEDSICKFIKTASHCNIKIKHLLTWSSGLFWKETYNETRPFHQSDVFQMLFGQGKKDMTTFILNRPIKNPPGEHYSYSSGDSNLLMSILYEIYAKKDAYFPFTKLFKPLGINSATWQQDGKGIYIGSSFFYATLRDYAKLGYLFLKKGRWGKKIIFEESWLNLSLKNLKVTYKNQPKKLEYPAAHLWLNNSSSHPKASKRKWSKIPDDAFYASGHWGQVVLIIPSLKTVIVRLASDKNQKFNMNTLFTLLRKNILFS